MPKYSTKGRREHDDIFEPLKGKKGHILFNGKNMYIPYGKAQNALMHMMNYFLGDFLIGQQQVNVIKSLRSLLPNKGGEFASNTMFKTTREIIKCGFVGETYTDWNSLANCTQENDMVINFNHPTNAELILDYIEMYYAHDHFLFYDEEMNLHRKIRNVEKDQQRAKNIVENKMLYSIYDKVVSLSDYREHEVNRVTQDILSEFKYKNTSLPMRLWMYFNQHAWKLVQIDEITYVLHKDFCNNKLFVDAVKSLIAGACFNGTSQDVSIDRFYRTRMTVSNKEQHLPRLKSEVLKLQAIIDHFSNLTVDTIFTDKNVDDAIKTVINKLEYYDLDFDASTVFENTTVRKLIGDVEEDYEKAVEKVQAGLDRAGITDERILELKDTLQLSIKIQKVA